MLVDKGLYLPSPRKYSVKGRLAGGQLTSLSSILQPGTRGVLSPGALNEDGITIRNISQPPLLDELNILDMPVILGDQSGELLPAEPLPQTTQQLTPAQATPVRVVIANKSPRVGRPPVKCTKIFISKGGTSEGGKGKTVYIGDINTAAKTVPKIRHIPATRNTQFYQ